MKRGRDLPGLTVNRRPTGALGPARYCETRLTAVLLLIPLVTLPACQKQTLDDPILPEPIEAQPQTPEERRRQYDILPAPPRDTQPSAQTLPYRPVAERYNAWAGQLKTLWSRVDATIQYVGGDGELKVEDAEGYLIARPPSDVALSLGKLGQTGLWVGRNAERYWLFELHESDTAYVGRLEHVGKPCSRAVNWPIQPAELPLVLGWRPVPVDGLKRVPSVTVRRGYATFVVPGTRLRYWVEPESGRPVRIDALGRSGEPELVCLLREPVTLAGAEGVMVPSRIDGVWLASGERLCLELKSPSDGRGGRRVQDGLFDFDVLVEELKPDEVVVVDEGCE